MPKFTAIILPYTSSDFGSLSSEYVFVLLFTISNIFNSNFELNILELILLIFINLLLISENNILFSSKFAISVIDSFSIMSIWLSYIQTNLLLI